jgi:nucleoside-diphosphate-sugar epimerase
VTGLTLAGGGRVLVAGVDGAIGRACAEAVTGAGGTVLGVDLDSVDITRPGGAEQAVGDAVQSLGGLDGVVHAVGMSGRRLGDGPCPTPPTRPGRRCTASTTSRSSACSGRPAAG